MKKAFKRFSVVLAAMSVLAAVTAPPAWGIAAAGLEVRIDVDPSSWAATGLVSDELSDAYYTCVLTATGFESTGFANGVILDYGIDSGNPCTTSTTGGFDSRYAAVQYTLTWTSVLGTTGTFVRTCVEALNVPICTPT